MDNISTINSFFEYKTNYFESFSEFIYKYNIVQERFLNILSCNIRSIKANVDELLLLLESEKKNFKPDIIILTETWHDTNSCNIFLPDYDMFFSKKKKETKMMVL